MQPVPCWEQAWVPSEVNPNLKVFKWIKTDKVQVRFLTLLFCMRTLLDVFITRYRSTSATKRQKMNR